MVAAQVAEVSAAAATAMVERVVAALEAVALEVAMWVVAARVAAA